MNGISLVLMAVAAWLVLTRAPFSMPVRVLTVFSGFSCITIRLFPEAMHWLPPLLALLALCYQDGWKSPCPMAFC